MKRKTFLQLLLLSSLWGCNKEEELVSKSILHIRDQLFEKNASDATSRVKNIMFNNQSATSPYKRFMITHISDPHVSNWSSDNQPTMPYDICEAVRFSNDPDLKINAFINTGDLINNVKETTKGEALKYLESALKFQFKENDLPTFVCLGNHDTNRLATNEINHLDQKTLNKYLFKYQSYPISNLEGENYYYADVQNPQGGMIRFIILNCTDTKDFPTADTQQYAIYSQQQMNWLCNTALKERMTSNHSIIIVNHFPFNPYSTKIKSFLNVGSFTHNWKMIPEIIEAFRKKEIIKYSYKSSFAELKAIRISADFSTTPGDFICHLGGHIHSSLQFTIEGLQNQSNILPKQNMLICTNMAPSEHSTAYKNINRSNPIENNSFNIYAIDSVEKKIYITEFGTKYNEKDPVIIDYL